MRRAEDRRQDNVQLVDLLRSRHIRTEEVADVFTIIDRVDYILPAYRKDAYKQHGNMHLLSPQLYNSVLKELCLEPGLSFLNLGSGTGYFSTMAGLLLKRGVNHGIELHEDCLRFAYERLEEVKQMLIVIKLDFCEPVFIQGNCLSVIPDRQYDRVYCGAKCPESHYMFITQFVRVGGILIIPYKDQLLRLQRVDNNKWLKRTIFTSVSIASLVVPPSSEHNLFHLPEFYNPLSLQELCRNWLRDRLHRIIWYEHPELEIVRLINQRQPEQLHTFRRFVIPIFEVYDETLTDDEISGRSSSNIGKHIHVTVVHYIDSNTFAVYMKEKIEQLPMPSSMKLYMNNITGNYK